jgi:hypothetical protein
MTSIVIPFCYSRSGTLELRYCLQSIRKHLHNYGEIFIIGDDPNLDGVTHIPAKDEPAYSNKERNIFNKMLLACADERVSDDFLYMNDDHFLLSSCEASEFPYYYSTDWESGQGLYMNTVSNTKARFQQCLNWDIHAPMLFNKKKFEWLKYLPWNTKFGFCMKTAYCESHGIKGQHMRDLKISEPTLTAQQIRTMLDGRKWFSIGEFVFREGGMKDVLDELYSEIGCGKCEHSFTTQATLRDINGND